MIRNNVYSTVMFITIM